MTALTNQVVATLAHMLRHHPEQHLVTVDAEGWTDLESVVIALRYRRREWSRLSRADLIRWVEEMPLQRFEIRVDQIRALYGHSLTQVATGVIRQPPTFLWHGTTSGSVDSIKINGLMPIGRRFVHLTSDQQYADSVAQSKSSTQFRDEDDFGLNEEDPLDVSTVILTVQAEAAFHADIEFRQANDHVWLAEQIPVRFVNFSSVDD